MPHLPEPTLWLTMHGGGSCLPYLLTMLRMESSFHKA